MTTLITEKKSNGQKNIPKKRVTTHLKFLIFKDFRQQNPYTFQQNNLNRYRMLHMYKINFLVNDTNASIIT